MKKIKKMAAFVLALTLIVGVVALPASASSHSYSMSTSEKTSGSHKYMDNSNGNYTLQYSCSLSGCRSNNDAATVKCFKDEWTYATRKPDDQTKFGNGSWSPWWGSCEKGDYNLELHAAASGRTLSTSGTFGNI